MFCKTIVPLLTFRFGKLVRFSHFKWSIIWWEKTDIFKALKLSELSYLCHRTWGNPNKTLCFVPQRRDRRGSNSDTRTLQFFPIWKGLERIGKNWSVCWQTKRRWLARRKGAIGPKGYTLLYRQVEAAWGEVLCARRTRWYEWDGKRKNIKRYS